jgi:hypothetical protein
MNKPTVLLALLLPLAATAAYAGGPLVRNIGFEESPTAPVGWRLSQHAGVTAYEHAIDEEVFFQGTRSFRMQRIKEQVYGLIDQRIRLPGGEPTRLQFGAVLRSRGVGPQGWVLTANFVDIEGGIIDQVRAEPVRGDTEWKPVALEAPIPPATHRIAIGVMLLDEGTGWVDDVWVRIGGE